MKTIGLIGGMSWESTLPYYRLVNEGIQARLGGLHSARIALYSVDFHTIEQLQRAGDWDTAGALLADAARRVQAAGADLLMLCTNTMHKVAPQMEAAVSIPLLHIADATAAAITAAGHRTVGLLGTRFTMEQDFYRQRLQDRHRGLGPAAGGEDHVSPRVRERRDPLVHGRQALAGVGEDRAVDVERHQQVRARRWEVPGRDQLLGHISGPG